MSADAGAWTWWGAMLYRLCRISEQVGVETILFTQHVLIFGIDHTLLYLFKHPVGQCII
jgi:hypothetical protein